MRKEFSFRVTPKGGTEIKPLPGKVLFPYTLIVAVTFLVAFFFSGGPAFTYHWLATANIVTYAVIVWVGVVGHMYDNRTHGIVQTLKTVQGVLWQVGLVTLCTCVDLLLHFGDILILFMKQ